MYAIYSIKINEFTILISELLRSNICNNELFVKSRPTVRKCDSLLGLVSINFCGSLTMAGVGLSFPSLPAVKWHYFLINSLFCYNVLKRAQFCLVKTFNLLSYFLRHYYINASFRPHWQNSTFRAVALLRRFCHIWFGFHFFGFRNNIYIYIYIRFFISFHSKIVSLASNPNQVSLFMSPSDRLALLHHQVLGFPFLRLL
jgi:hypothetical protein